MTKKKHPFQGDWSSFSKLSKHHVRAEQQQEEEEDTITALSSGCLWHATLRVNLSKCCCCQDEWNHSLVTDQTVSWSLHSQTEPLPFVTSPLCVRLTSLWGEKRLPVGFQGILVFYLKRKKQTFKHITTSSGNGYVFDRTLLSNSQFRFIQNLST